jgi:uncharacterized protein (DUF3820 family)
VIEFTTSFGKFNVPILATLPQHYLSFLKEIDFQYCPVREVARKTFILKNTGELTSEFEWECSSPFRVIPSRGELQEGKEIKMTVEFKPMVALVCYSSFQSLTFHVQDAFVYSLNTIIQFGDFNNPSSLVKKSMKIHGIGKYSFICIVDNPDGRFDFGEVLVGKSKDIHFVLYNPSVVSVLIFHGYNSS